MKVSLAVNPNKLGFDLRESWQARVLEHARGKLGAVVLSVLSHNYDEAVLPLLDLLFPGHQGVVPPFICSAGRISARGRVYAQVVERQGDAVRNDVLYRNETELQNAFRGLADELKLSDKDRLELFAAVKNWIVCDYRIDPATGEKEHAG